MLKNVILILAVTFLLFGYKVFANVSINEIMYAPATGANEWIEVINSGNDSIDLTDWRFFNNTDDSAPLRLQKGSAVLAPGGYALITSSTNWDIFSGTVFTSSQFSLPDDSSKYNTYKAISDSNKTIIDSITYNTSLGGDKTSGNSLAKINNVWQAAVPTPNAENYVVSNNIVDSSDSVNGLGSLVSNIPSSNTNGTKTVETSKIKTKILAKTTAFVNTSVEFNATTTGYSGETLYSGKYFWNFGDGDSKEIKIGDTTKFTHTFFYPGEYTVALQYFQNYYSQIPDAIDKLVIKVVPADILISNVGEAEDFFVEILNNTAYEADLSGWILSSAKNNFTFPANTILSSKGKMILSPKITGFSILDKDTLKLINKEWETVFDYASALKINKIIKNVVSSPIQTKVNDAVSLNGKLENNIGNNNEETEALRAPASMEAQAALSDFNSSDNFKYYIYAFILLIIGVGSAYFVRIYGRKNILPQNGNDFEIIDE